MADGIASGELRVMIVLLSGTWLGVARFPRALNAAGFRVAAFCQADSFLSKTRYAEPVYPVPATGSAFPALVRAVRQFRPDLLIPGCDLSVRFLHEIVRGGADGRVGEAMRDIVALARRSLGSPEYFRATLSKHEAIEAAAGLGLRTPRQAFISGSEEALRRAAEYGYPLVLKGEFGFAGNEVRICADAGEVVEACQALLRGDGHRVAAQEYIHGSIAMHAVVAAAGTVLENLSTIKERIHPQPAGPSSVLRFVENEELELATSALVRRFGYSGFGSADFIIDADTGSASFLEFNPRPVASCSLGALFGRDLCRALHCHLAGVPYQRQPNPDVHETVALYPNETLRDPHSPYLTQAYHDIPVDDPELLQAVNQAFFSREQP